VMAFGQSNTWSGLTRNSKSGSSAAATSP